MRRRANTSVSNESPRTPLQIVPLSEYPHVSSYRFDKLELQLYSPSLKVHEGERGALAVFSEHDKVSGKINLDSSCRQSGRLSVAIEGSFTYFLPKNPREIIIRPKKYVFLSSAATIALSGSDGNSSKSVFRDTFTRRRPSMSSINFKSTGSERSHDFSFLLPKSTRKGEELPATFNASSDSATSQHFNVTYKVVVKWEPNDPIEMPSRLEVPFVVLPDSDFQSLDAIATKPETWLELPLTSDRPVPVRCAVTLPASVKFSRSSSIPYFVVYTTTPRNSEMAKEIAADATISVSLIRQIGLPENTSMLPTPPLTPSRNDSDPLPRAKLLRRVAKSQPKLRRRSSDGSIPLSREKPLPQIPSAASSSFTDMRTINNDICLGFPKRPRLLVSENHNHPSLESVAAMPDGLYKTRIQLDKDMLPSIDWAGVSVKYYLHVSVLLGHDEIGARVPVRII